MNQFWRRFGFFLVFTAIGLLFFSYHYLDDLARGHYGMASERFIEEMTGAYAGLVLLPFVFRLARRYPWTATTWESALLVQLAGLVGYSAVHTTLMALSRAVLFPLAGLGSYDYGVMLYRYPMEASHDAIVYTVMIVLIYLFDRLDRARRAEIDAAQLQTALAEAKLENLRLQLHPHFLFNTLNAISSVMYEDVRKADAMLVRLSDFLRVILSSTDIAEIPLEEELQIESMYFSIMKARLESKLQLSLDVGEDAGKALVPSLILQPLIENAIQHGMGTVRDSLDISIAAQRTNGTMHITVSDNGIGFAPSDRSHDGGGQGLANVKSRLSHLYGDESLFTIQGTDGGTKVRMDFPYHDHAAS